jgi:hypothetical protein
MAYTSWTQPKVRTQDFNPHKRPSDAARDSYRRQIAERERFGHGAEGDGAIQHWKYRRPIGPNRHLVEHPKDPTRTVELPATASNAAFVADSYVAVATDRTGSVIIGTPAPGRKGTSGFAVDGGSSSGAFGITSVDPPEIPFGATQDITVIGFGFNGNESFRAVIFQEANLVYVTDTQLTINTTVFVDSMNFTLNVTSAAPVGYEYSIEVTR